VFSEAKGGIYVDSIPIATLKVLHRALQKGNRYPVAAFICNLL
jgi:hypothetical protein